MEENENLGPEQTQPKEVVHDVIPVSGMYKSWFLDFGTHPHSSSALTLIIIAKIRHTTHWEVGQDIHFFCFLNDLWRPGSTRRSCAAIP